MGSQFQASSRPHSEHIPLAELIRQAVDGLLAHHPTEIGCDFDLDPQIIVRQMPDKIRDLVHALVRQSLQEMDGGGELTITAWSDGERVELEIADTGRSVAQRPTRLPLVAAVVGARLHWQDCPQGGAAVTVDLGCQTARNEAA